MTDKENDVSHTCQQTTVPLMHKMPCYLLPGDVLGSARELWYHQQPLLSSPRVIPVYEGLGGVREWHYIAGSPTHGVGGVLQEPFQGISGLAKVEDAGLGPQDTVSRTLRLRRRRFRRD